MRLQLLPVWMSQSVMITIKDSDCLIVIPPEKKGIAAGEQVILKLPHGQAR